MRPLNVAIVGSGVAGAAAALFLRRVGHCITQFEQAADDALDGAGLLLQPPGLAVLRAAGLSDALWTLGQRVDHIGAHFVDTHQKIRLDYAEYDSTTHACGIHRAALLRILREADGHSKEIRWLARISGVDAQRGIIELDTGERLDGFDLIVAADGTRSTIRSRCPEIVRHNRAYEDAAIVCVIDDPKTAFGTGVCQRFINSTHVSTWPIGTMRLGGANRLTIALRVGAGDLSRLVARPAEWLNVMSQIYPALADAVRSSPTQPELLPYTFRDVYTHRYYHNRVVLIGDAAHAMSPQLGLGASLGLVDAWTLSRCLAKGDAIANALIKFDHVRRNEVESCQRISRLVTPFFQSDNRLVAALRGRSAVAFSRTDAFRRRALEVLCKVPRDLDSSISGLNEG